MPQTSTVPVTFGDSLRALADVVDQVPSLVLAVNHPDVPRALILDAKSSTAVEGLAAVLDVEVQRYTREDYPDVHTFFEIERGRLAIRVVAIEPKTRELHRDPESIPAHEQLEP